MKGLIKTQFPLLLIILFEGCSTSSSSSLQKSKEENKVHRIGYIDLYKSSNLLKIYSETTRVFRQSVPSSFRKYCINDVSFIRNGFSKLIDFEQPDTSLIQILCLQDSLDALLLTKVIFINTDYYIYAIPAGKSMDTEVEMKLYSRSAKLLATSLFNTKRQKDYIKLQPGNVIVHDATLGAIKDISWQLGYRRECE